MRISRLHISAAFGVIPGQIFMEHSHRQMWLTLVSSLPAGLLPSCPCSFIQRGRLEPGNGLCSSLSLQAERQSCGSLPVVQGRHGRELTAVLPQELNERWRSLQQLAEERSQLLGSAHEVQRFHR